MLERSTAQWLPKRRDSQEVAVIFAQPRVDSELACGTASPGQRFVMGRTDDLRRRRNDRDRMFHDGSRLCDEDVTVSRQWEGVHRLISTSTRCSVCARHPGTLTRARHADTSRSSAGTSRPKNHRLSHSVAAIDAAVAAAESDRQRACASVDCRGLRDCQCGAGNLRERQLPVVHVVRGREPVSVGLHQLVSGDDDPAEGRRGGCHSPWSTRRTSTMTHR